MNSKDIRWIQRYNHFAQAFVQLEKAVRLSEQRPLSELEEQGMIQLFEYTHELAWNVPKDFLEGQGLRNLFGSIDSTSEAFKRDIIKNGEVWMDMVKKRNLSSYTYNRDTAREIVHAIQNHFYQEFSQLLLTLKPFTGSEST